MQTKRSKNWIALVLGGLMLAAYVTLCTMAIVEVAYPRFLLVAETQNADGIALDTAFILTDTMERGTDPEELLANITFEPLPGHGYTIEPAGDFTYRLVPGGALLPGGQLDVQVYDQHFQFAVQNRLRVLECFPATGSKNVPVNTGIEIVFNTSDVTREAFAAALSIAPGVEGRVRVTGNRYIFVPTSPLAYNKTYTVWLNENLTSENGAMMTAGYKFTFKTQETAYPAYANSAQFQMSGNGISVNSLASETPLFQAYIAPELASSAKLGSGGSVSATVLAFSGWEDYASQLSQNTATGNTGRTGSDNNIVMDTSGLAQAASFDIEPVRAFQGTEAMDTNQWMLPFPEALPEGWYAVEFKLGAATRRMFLQVSDLSVFYMWSAENFLAWVNDAATGQPVSGAQVALSGDYSLRATTGEDGTAQAADAVLPAEDRYGLCGNLVTVTAGNRVFVDINKYYYYDYSYGYGSTVDARRYISYLFLDRPTYHTSDTIHVWGMVRPRDTAVTEAPQTATLAFTADNTRQTVQLLPDGTFTAEIAFTDMLADRWSNVDLMVGDTVVFSQYVVIEDFVKPIFTTSTRASQEIYLVGAGPTPTVELTLAMFDGTPAPSVGVTLASYSEGVSVPAPELQTDANGIVSAEVQVAAVKDTWYPQYVSCTFHNNDAQAENFYAYGSFYAIHRDVMLQTERQPLGDDRFDLLVSANQVDPSGLTDTAQLWQTDALKGAALDIPIRAEIYKIYYTKERAGTYYSYINRTMQEMYTYTRHEELVETQNLATQNGTVLLTNLPKAGEGETYYVELSCSDTLSRPVRTTVYLGKLYEYYGMQGSGLRYELRKTNADPAWATANTLEQDSWTYRYYGSAFYDGESTTFSLLANEEPVQQMPGRLLYSVVQDGFSNTGIAQQGSFTLPFAENLLPNYVLTGAYFDGKHVYPLENTQMYFDPMQRELEIDLATDKDSYRPADPVTVTADVRNKLTGEPAPDVTLVLSVVDEAVFAIREQYINILERLYQRIYSPVITKYVSYHQGNLPSPGEKGNGGEDSLRTDFKDTAYFATLTTDQDGRASWRFTLPDNITGWRLTSLGVDGRNYAGSTKINVSASKEFFLMPVVNEDMLAGDSFAVGLRSAGVGVTEADTVQYTVRIQGPGVDETRKAAAPLRTYTALEFDGVAREGSYTATIEGRCGDYYDGVQLPIAARASGVEVSLVQTVDLSAGIDIAPLRYPVSMVFYSEGAKTYNEVLRSATRSSYGARADMRLARTFVAQLMQTLDRSWYDKAALEQNLADIDGRTMLSILPYSTPDFELSLRAHLAAPGLVSLDFFENMSESTLESLEQHYNGSWAAQQLARALAGQPLDDNVNTYIANTSSLDYVEKIWLVMALAASGKEAHARQWYQTLVADNLAELERAQGPNALYVSGVKSSRTPMACTAAALMLATRLETEHAEGLALYLAARDPKYDLYILEQLYYLRMNQPAAGGVSGRFSYRQGGATVEQTVGTGMQCLTFNAAQLAEADFKVLSGSVLADVYYVSAPADVALPGTERMGITKKIEPASGDGFATGALVKVTITPDFSALPSGHGNYHAFVVDEYIPAGLRFEKMQTGDYGRGWYMDNRQGQRLQFNVYSLYTESWRTPIVYYARVATPGTFVVESTYMNSAYGDAWGATDRTQVTLG